MPGTFDASWFPSGSGSGAFFDVATGFLSRLPPFGFSTASCAVSAHPGNAVTLPAINVLPGSGIYVLVRERNSCGLGRWGAGSDGVPRAVPACP